MTGRVAQVPSYHSTMHEFTELLSQMFAEAVSMPTVGAQSYTPVAVQVIGTPEFDVFDG